ncbi:hypothetical protein Q5P01_019992 [Channa striata]|uniref:Uncharacterized protein n=1 Tax=Channa striata TaxID=64152 RepID=A0AA88LWT2_CHASR|nr:hypothetical protein Q5P01_019992 [Channa striata]
MESHGPMEPRSIETRFRPSTGVERARVSGGGPPPLSTSEKKRGRENRDGDGGDEENSSCDLGCPHACMVGRMNREITELKGALEEERRLRSEALRA